MVGKRIAVFSLIALATVGLALFSASQTHAQGYKPTFTYSVTDNTHGAASDTSNTIDIDDPDYNYEDSSMYTFNPIDGSSVTGPEVAIADRMGTLTALSTVGLLGQACAEALTPTFVMENATIDTSEVLEPDDMYWVLKDADDYPVPYDQYDPDIPDYLEAMPHFINEMLDPDGPDGPKPPLQPRARYVGYSDEVSNMNIIVQIVVLNPGQLSQLPGIKGQMTQALGHPSLVVLNNPVSQDEAPGSISDFCTPLNTVTTLYGTTLANVYNASGGGTVARTNPPEDSGVLGSGTHIARNYSMSERDAEGDGHENDLDPCPYQDDTGWDPRAYGAQAGYDSDGDHLPDSCDPDDADMNTDEDEDGYDNGQDICPLVPNGCSEASCSPEFPPVYDPSWDNQADSEEAEPNADVGPGPDSIGDSCDDSDNDGKEDGTSDGTQGAGDCTDGIDNDDDGLIDELDPECADWWDKADSVVNLDWGTNPGTGQFYHALTWNAVTINSAVDTDGDGYSDSLECYAGCTNDVDDDPTDDGQPAGTYINDGCPAVDAAETDCGPDESLPLDDDDDGYVNDGCPAVNSPECDSDPGDPDSTPESYVIDATISAGAGTPPGSGALPGADALQSCSDTEDNDGDGYTDDLDDGCTCPTGTDGDCDGVPDGDDNCPSDWNPEQTNTDGDSQGDVCDPDDDDDGTTDAIEWWMTTDPLDDCSNVAAHAAWPLDMDNNKLLNLGGDAAKYIGKIGLLIEDDWSLRRLDQDGNGLLNLGGDAAKFIGKIGNTCT